MTMELPLDATTFPLPHSKVRNASRLTADWWGWGPGPKGLMDIADPFGPVLLRVPKDQARRIIAARKAWLDSLITELCGSPTDHLPEVGLPSFFDKA